VTVYGEQVSLDTDDIGEAVKKAQDKPSDPILARFYDCGGHLSHDADARTHARTHADITYAHLISAIH
jgi:hypothetical protein